MTTSLKTLALAALTLFALTACNLSAVPPTPNTEAVTSEALTQAAAQPFPTATTLPMPTDAPTIAATGISLVLPQEVASRAIAEVLPQASGPDLPPWDVHPAYTRTTLQGYPLEGTVMKPEIHIYPAQAFADISPGAAEIIANLKTLLASQSPLPAHLPFLPLSNAGQVFYSNPARLSFQNGLGIRYLTQLAQAPLPVNNHELIYTFQGFTNDGRFYVAATLPINAGFLSVDANPQSPVPPDGIPFDWNDPQAMPAYLQAVKQRLESVPPESFVPNLSALDEMIASLKVDLP